VNRLSSACVIALFSILTLPAGNAYAREAATSSSDSSSPATVELSDEARDAQARVADAASVVHRMKADPKLGELIQRAKGLLIVPHFFKAAFLVGGQHGSGLMLVQQGGRWSDPVFYKTSSGSFGAQIGGSRGTLVMILMSDKAIASYSAKASSWSMDAGAGLTAAHYSKDMERSNPDVVIWTDNAGLFAGASVGATRGASDEHANQAYYNHTGVTPQQILIGLIANPYSNKLREMLPIQQASR